MSVKMVEKSGIYISKHKRETIISLKKMIIIVPVLTYVFYKLFCILNVNYHLAMVFITQIIILTPLSLVLFIKNLYKLEEIFKSKINNDSLSKSLKTIGVAIFAFFSFVWISSIESEINELIFIDSKYIPNTLNILKVLYTASSLAIVFHIFFLIMSIINFYYLFKLFNESRKIKKGIEEHHALDMLGKIFLVFFKIVIYLSLMSASLSSAKIFNYLTDKSDLQFIYALISKYDMSYNLICDNEELSGRKSLYISSDSSAYLFEGGLKVVKCI